MKHRLLSLCVAIAAVAACSPNLLAPAQVANAVDTVSLGALSHASLQTASAFDISLGFAVRTDQTSAFDFIYDVDSTGQHLLIPIHAIAGLGITNGSNPGFVRMTKTFEEIIAAPEGTYLTDDPVVINVGDVLAARSRLACYLSVPQYAKMQVLSFDDAKGTVTFEILSDTNCGYKNLQPGVPTN